MDIITFNSFIIDKQIVNNTTLKEKISLYMDYLNQCFNEKVNCIDGYHNNDLVAKLDNLGDIVNNLIEHSEITAKSIDDLIVIQY